MNENLGEDNTNMHGIFMLRCDAVETSECGAAIVV